MPLRVLILDNTLHPRFFPLARRWSKLLDGRCRVDVVRAPSAPHLPDVRRYSHVLLTGSEASILKPAPWMEREADLVREACEAGRRVLGSCFGHELLVWALSGPEHLKRAERPEFGWISVNLLERDELLRNLPNPWTVFAFHLVEVDAPPSPWRVLASSRRCAVHVLRYGDRPVWGFQAHPEITRRRSELAARVHLLWMQHRGGIPRSTWRRHPADLQAADDLVARFLGDGHVRG